MSGTLKVGGKTLATHDTNTNVSTLTVDEANVGSNALVVDSSGNVGIGISPSTKLEVSGIASFGVNENDYINARGGNGTARVEAVGTNTDVNLSLATKGSGLFYFWSGGYGGTERMRIDSSGVVSINTGYVTLNNNKVGGIQVTIADDAYAEITPPRIGAHFMAITEGGDEGYPSSGCYGFVYADFGGSPLLVQVSVGSDVQTSTSGPPTGTTGNDAYLTLFVGGTSGKIYLENRLGFTGVFQITFL